MERKLATIRRIADIQPNPNADNLETVIVDGWTVVSQKGIHQIGTLVIFFEIDSFLPVIPQFEWMRKNCFRSTTWAGDGFRVKTVKLRGQLSQGLVMPLHELIPDEYFSSSGFVEGSDVTEFLKVQKWDPPLNAAQMGVAKGNFPSFIRKTDQERIQNIYSKLTRQERDTRFEVSIKLDGSSMTIYCKYDSTSSGPSSEDDTTWPWSYGVCSRNFDQAEQDDSVYWRAAKQNGLIEGLKEYCKGSHRSIAIQGELMGPGVQGNKDNFKDLRFFMFDVWDIDNQKYLLPAERYQFRDNIKKMMPVPILDHVPVEEFHWQPFFKPMSLDELLAYASTHRSLGQAMAEGVVLKAIHKDLSFKIISNTYLIKEK